MDQSQSQAQAQAREWLYLDQYGSQKGPLPSGLLLRLLDKGIGVSGATTVWKAGMTEWLPMSQVEPFKSVVQFQEKQWYYVDSNGNGDGDIGTQRGPIITRLLLHKIKEGALDGLSLIYSHDIGEWKKLNEIDVLRSAYQQIISEEEAAENALKLMESASHVESQQQQVYVGDDGGFLIPTIPEEMLRKQAESVAASVNGSQSADGATGKGSSTVAVAARSFVADDGIRYRWDDGEQDWVEDSECEDDDGADGDDEDGENDDNDGKGKGAGYKARSHNSNQKTAKSQGLAADNSDNSGDDEGEKTSAADGKDKPKRKRKKKTKRQPAHWVYVTGLPPDIEEEEIKAHFSKVGLIAINPLDQQPKIRVYRDNHTDQCKGDCSLCYNAPESVQLAIDILSGGYIRPKSQITVSKADFSSASTTDNNNTKRQKNVITAAQRKVAMAAMKQALAWNEDDDSGVSRSQALKIVVLEGMFSPEDMSNDPGFASELEDDVASECGKCGEIDKITLFSENPRGIIIVKFKTGFAAQECIRLMDGRFFAGRKLRCFFWDGSTNYAVSTLSAGKDDEAEEKRRLEEFGQWLEEEQGELPEEFKLRVES